MATDISKVLQTGLISMIRCYRYTLSLFVRYSCRFTPTCSAYAIEAIQRHGCIYGGVLTMRRILRCHPWHPGGIDTVPSQQKSTTIC